MKIMSKKQQESERRKMWGDRDKSVIVDYKIEKYIKQQKLEKLTERGKSASSNLRKFV